MKLIYPAKNIQKIKNNCQKYYYTSLLAVVLKTMDKLNMNKVSQKYHANMNAYE